MYVLYAYIRVCMHLCVYAFMYICMHVCIHVCIYVIFKLGFERYGGIVLVGRGNIPGGKCPGGLSRGEMSGPRSKLPLLSSPTQVLERNIYSLLSQYPVTITAITLYDHTLSVGRTGGEGESTGHPHSLAKAK